MKTICLDNFFDIHELFWLYNSLLRTTGWNFAIKPNTFTNNPNEFHTGSNPSQDCPYVRLTCNIVVGK